jgi:hypothetical protein
MVLSQDITVSDAATASPGQRPVCGYAQKSMAFINRITDTLSNKMVRKVKNRWGDEIWPWDREGFKRPSNRSAH